MKALFLALACLVSLAPEAGVKGPVNGQQANASVTVTLVRWPFT